MSRATEGLMDALHGTIADDLLRELRNYREGKYLDKEGNPMPVPAALMAQAIKFLKDNGVDAPSRPGDKLDRLAAMLPDLPSPEDHLYN